MKLSFFNSLLTTPRLLITRVPLLIWVILLSISCGQDSREPGSGGPQQTFTASITAQNHLCAGDDLTAVVIIDGGSPIPLDVDCESGTVTGVTPALTLGPHTFVIEYSINNILVATAETTSEVVSGGPNVVELTPDLLEFPDDDGDGWTNLAEVKFGTDHLLASSRPPFELPRSSSNYVLVDRVGNSPMVGIARSSSYYEEMAIPGMEEATTSTNYSIR